MDDVWKAPDAAGEARAPVGAGGAPPAKLDDPLSVGREVLADLKQRPFAYLMAGLGYFAAVLGVVAVAIVGLGVGMAPGILLEDENLLAIGGIFGFAIYMGAIFGFAFLGFPLMSASLLRSLDAQRAGGPSIGFTSSFSRMRERAVQIVLFYLLSQLAVLVGMLFLYVPGLAAAAIGSFALPIVVFEEVGAMRALQLGFEHFRRHLSWHVGVWAMLLVAVIVLELTLVGLFVIWPVMVAYQLVAYRQAFGAAGAEAALQSEV